MFRFSQAVVPTGQVPSGAKAPTGSRSPLPASMSAVTLLTWSGASSGTIGGRQRSLVTCPGSSTWCMLASDWSTAAKFFSTTLSPFLP